MSIQIITSKNKSVNTTKVPYLFKHVDWKKIKDIYGKVIVLDFGCGRETKHISDFLNTFKVPYEGYDPYWKGGDFETFQQMVTDYYEKGYTVIITMSNVLNVISDWNEVKKIQSWINYRGEIFFAKIYEGDKTGVGRITKQDCWQWNKPTEDYLTRYDETIKKGVITCWGNTQFII